MSMARLDKPACSHNVVLQQSERNQMQPNATTFINLTKLCEKSKFQKIICCMNEFLDTSKTLFL